MDIEEALKALKKYYGYDKFRPMQEEIIQSVFDGKDSLVLMPTGGGKSLCFQIPAIVQDGLCIVISPLISLMKDQVDSLNSNGIKSAFINSSLTSKQQFQLEVMAKRGFFKLIYISPERLLSEGFLSFLKKLKINLFAIDEAHCISAWGHDFREEYTKLSFLKENFPEIPVMALTATADKLTRKDIVSQLNLENPEIFISSFDRPNISLSVFPAQERTRNIINFINTRKGQAGIIYCLSRKGAESLARKLQDSGINADYYHAGLSSEDRNSVQDNFIKDKIQIICATIAFGMGIDKSNVRWVIHYNLSKNIESYYQEIGRAGRDGLKSEAILFYTFADLLNIKTLIEESSQKELHNAKLERMKQYADSLICRRKILLNYFGENLLENCNNCDVCKNPPVYLDGTEITQKVLSALWWIKKMDKKVSSGLLIDILRGTSRFEILSNEFHKIKTYGAGKNISHADWQSYIIQIINLGFIDIAYDHNYVLALTEASREVLYNNLKVQLIDPKIIRKATEENTQKFETKKDLLFDSLFERLRTLRKQISEEENIPPYRVFSDATLNDIVDKKPTSKLKMRNVSGIGELKYEKYGEKFLEVVREFLGFTSDDNLDDEILKAKNKPKTDTLAETLILYKQGLSVEEIAEKRELSISTIWGHIASLHETTFDIDIYKFVDHKEMNLIFKAIKYFNYEYKLKDIFAFLEEKIDYNKIKLAISHHNKTIGLIAK
ncbi:MAG: DNA helicase RecQ [Candidatus Sericytochromatia bacterium]